MLQRFKCSRNSSSLLCSATSRTAFARRDFLAVLIISVFAFGILPYAILYSRESARRQLCSQNLKRFGTAFSSYHTTYKMLPPAAIWKSRQFDDLNQLHQTRQFESTTYTNWIQLLLPFLGKQELVERINGQVPIGAPENESIRTTSLPVVSCPSDEYQSIDNSFRWQSVKYGQIFFARGSYAINGGTQRFAQVPGTSADPVPNGFHLEIDSKANQMSYWGNGIAGFNRSFTFSDFENGLSTTVAIDEIRAGIHPDDSRGVWALGQIGGSVTWSHGMNGDAGHPNDLWKRADDIIGCDFLHRKFGEQTLIELGMPCCPYCPANDQATARSRHKNGVHILLLDGSVRFVSNSVDLGVWHVMHSRETPSEILSEDFDQHLVGVESKHSTAQTTQQEILALLDKNFQNSLGMSFVQVKPGRFIMGLADEEINAVFDIEEFPKAHWAQISHPFYLGQHEVTQAQFSEVMGYNPSRNQSEKTEESNRFESYPVENVTYEEAHLFCQRLSEIPEELSANRTYRIPTEAEWEYACRSGNQKPYIYIPDRQPGDRSGENAMKNPPLPLTRVGQYPANDFGLFDMRGNVWEWCRDWFDRDYYNNSSEIDPQGPKNGYLKVVRGCDWIFVGQRCSLGFRAVEPWKRSPYIGFRIVCEVQKDK